MRTSSAIRGLLLALWLTAGPAAATTWYEVTKVCPVGGKKFKSQEMGSNSYFGQRPDGRPYSPSPIPPIDECPDNGFVIFDDKFTKQEIAQLTALVASSEYKALRVTETRHFRAWWLMEKLQRDPYQLAIRLMLASWETDHEPDRKARYQAEFIRQTLALEFTEARREDWFWLRMRAANALREAGKFDESNAIVSSTYVPEKLPKEPDQQEGAKRLAEGLLALNRDRNTHPEPANLIPPRVAIERCEVKDVSATEVEACGSQAVKDEIEEQRKWREAEVQAETEGITPEAEAAAVDAAVKAAESAVDAANSTAEESRNKRKKN